MFRRRNPKADEAKELFTYIHQGTVVEGKLTAEGRVRVHGVVRGDVAVKGVLEVAESGVVSCDRLSADHVKIIGRVSAKRLEATGKVEIWKGGELVGDVRAAALDIEDGARFTGRSEMTGPDAPGAARPAEAPEAPEDDQPLAEASGETASAQRAGESHSAAELAALIVEP